MEPMERLLKTVWDIPARPMSLVLLVCGLGFSSYQTDPSKADDLQAKLELVLERYENDVKKPKDFEVGEEEANAYFEHRLVDHVPDGIVDPWVRFSEGLVRAGATLDLDILRERMPSSSMASLLSGRVPVELTSGIHAEEGVGKLALQSVTLGGLPVPPSILQQIVTAYTKSTSRPDGVRLDESFPLPYGIESARIEQGRVLFRQSGSRATPSGVHLLPE
jgi:hypothetical protein